MNLPSGRLILLSVMVLLSITITHTVFANGGDNDFDPRLTGMVEVQADGSCPTGKFSGGDRCIEFTITGCPAIDDAVGAVRISGSGAAGTVVLTTGGPGRGLFGNQIGDIVGGFLDALLDDGYLLVELAWDDLGAVNPPGVWEGPGTTTSVACRPATAFNWIFDDIHKNGLFIGQGNSGGSAQLSFSLAYYGVDVFDLVNLSGGPPPCPSSSGGIINFSEQVDCVVGGALFDESREPMLFGDPLLDYPNTTVRFFIGKDEPSTYITATANSYHDRITSATSIRSIPHTAHQVQRAEKGAKALLASIRKAAHTARKPN